MSLRIADRSLEQESTVNSGRAVVTVVRASIAQLAEVRQLLQEYFEAVNVVVRDTPDQVRNCLGSADCGFWIAYVGEVPAGCVVLRPLPTLWEAVECKRLYVRPAFRGRGLADRLLDAMELHAVSLGSRWIYLDSKDDLHEALRIYKKRGYEPCDRYNENPQATIFLRRELEQPPDFTATVRAE